MGDEGVLRVLISANLGFCRVLTGGFVVSTRVAWKDKV